MATNSLLDVQDPQNASRLVDWYLGLFSENIEFLFNHALNLYDGYAIMGTTLDDFRQMLVADNFRFLRSAADQNNEDVDEVIISVFEVMEDGYPGFTDAFREAAPELASQFTSDGITLGPPDDTPTPNPQPGIAEPAQTVTEEPAPETPEDESAAEEAAPEPETETEATPEPEPEPITPPPPGSRGNPIMPRIEIDEPAISFDQIIDSVRDIQTQLDNLPEDPAQRENVLNEISDTLQDMAIALTPSAANDARLTDIPPRTSTATFEGVLGTLNGTMSTILLHNDVSSLTEYLVRGSQQASIVAREAAALIAPEIEIAPEADLDTDLEAEAETEATPLETDPAELSYADIIMQGMERAREEMEAERAARDEAEPETEEAPASEPEAAILPDVEDDAAAIILEEEELQALAAEEAPDTVPAQPEEPTTRTELRLSEFLDGHGYHNDTDGYTDFDALEDAFSRAAELGITTEHIENIRVRINEPDFILKTSAAITALSAYNEGMQASGEAEGLSAFFNAIAPEDFVRDRLNSIDDTSVFDRAERDQVREATLRIEDTFKP